MLEEFLLSDEFNTYRQKQLKAVLDSINLFNILTEEEFYEFKGKLDMARRLIRLPTELTDKPGVKDAILRRVVNDLQQFQAKVILQEFDEDYE